ncbi:hypothetical protein ACFSJD_42990 [Pseudonocardia yunnanensis]|uniref:Uncharacterized protein n=1 Tax=Pseudonocardia yunnanensis TaxID=58107 RepID=A0ABW4F9L6_9PSEU
MMSATTWPDPAEESVWTWQPLWSLVQLPLELEVPVAGGPRAPPAPFSVFGPSVPDADVRAVPVQVIPPPAQSMVAEAIVQLDAPGTVGPPEFALDPGATGAGSVAGWSCPSGAPCCGSSCCWSPDRLDSSDGPMLPSLTVAFAVERACTSGAMMFASGPDEAPEFVTAWQTPPATPSQVPSLCEPRGSGDTDGSVAVALLVTFPSQRVSPSQARAPPAAEAADGPGVSLDVLTGFGSPFASTCGWSPASASAAPDPVEAVDTDRTSQPPVPPSQVALPVETRGAPPLTAPSQASVLVFTAPEQPASAHCRLALDDAVELGPLVGWPATGSPVSGSVTTKSGAEDAAEVASPAHPPSVTVQFVVARVPRACGDTAVSRALVSATAVPPQVPSAPSQRTCAEAWETLTGPDTAVTPSAASAGSRSATVVSVAVEQFPPAPCTVQFVVAVLSRTPTTSPEAAPVVVLAAAPRHSAAAQSACAPAVLDAASSRPGAPSTAARKPSVRAAVSLTSETDSAPQVPAAVSHVEEPLVVRTAGLAPAATAPVTLPLVFVAALPVHAAPSPQSTFALAVLAAKPSPSVVTPGAPSSKEADRTAARSSVALPTRVPLSAPQSPPAAAQVASPLLVRSAPAARPVAVPVVAARPFPVQPAPSQSSATAAVLAPPASRFRAVPPWPEPDSDEQPPPVTVQFALPVVVASGAAGLAAAAAVPVAARSVSARSVALVVEAARPVQPVAPSTHRVSARACAPSSDRRSPTSTELDVPHPPAAASQCAVALARRVSSPFTSLLGASTASCAPVVSRAAVVEASRTSARSVAAPELEVSHTPAPVAHPASAPPESA